MKQPRDPSPLPPGQVEIDEFPRFGLANLAFRFPTETERIELAVDGDVEAPARFTKELESLERLAEKVGSVTVVASPEKMLGALTLKG